MKRTLQKHRRLAATGILFAFVVAWVLPAQACFVPGAAVHSGCPDCPSPLSCDPASCGVSLTAPCTASMGPAAVAPAHSLDKTAAAPAALDAFAAPVHETEIKPTRTPATQIYPPSTSLNIRFCTFLE